MSPRLRSGIVLGALGASSLVWQVASARSLLEHTRGNELGLGITLMTWLLLVGAGSGLGAWLARAAGPTLLAWTLLLTPPALLVSLALQVGPALVEPGLVAGPARSLWLALLCLAPACLPLGVGFALAAQAPEAEAPGRWASLVFAVESLGTVAAGLLFHFVLARSGLRTAGLVAGVLAWLAALPLLVGVRRRGLLVLPAVIGAIGLVYLLPLHQLPLARVLERRVPGYRLLEHRSSTHAALAVLARGDQILFTANGQVVFTDQDEQRVESEVHLALLAHPAPRRLLLVGVGLGVGAGEALKHRPEQVDYVELDPVLVELAQRHSPTLTRNLDDKRVRLLLGDGRKVIATSPPASYDVILIGVPGPSSALLNRFYTEELFAAARRALRPGGILQVSLEGGEGYLTRASVVAHLSVTQAMRRAGLHPVPLPSGSTLLLGGHEREPGLEAALLLRRLEERGLSTRFFGTADVMDRTLPFKRQIYQQALREAGSELGAGSPLTNTDLAPRAYFESSLLWLAMGSPGLAERLLLVGQWGWRWPFLAPLLGLAVGLLGARLRRRRPAAGLALACAGFAGLALELEVLLACQLARGIVYHELGILMAGFMLGLAAGALAGRALLASSPRWALTLALGGVAASALVTLPLLTLALKRPAVALAVLLLALVVVGACVGACYPPAAALLARHRGASASARAYAWDLLGAALGALIATALALPVLGLPSTAMLCAALCAGCAIGLRRS